MSIITTRMQTAVAIRRTTPDHSTPARVPRLHSYISATSSSSALNLMKVVMALNTYINAIPTRIIIVEPVRLNDEMRMMTTDGINEKRNALTIIAASPTTKGTMET